MNAGCISLKQGVILTVQDYILVIMTENEQLARRFFKSVPGEPHKWKCTCMKVLAQRNGSGWTNLVNHIKIVHAEPDPTSSSPAITNFLRSPKAPLIFKKTVNVSGWIDWVCMGLKPFNFIEDSPTRKYTNLGKLPRNTFLKYMDALTKEIEKSISTKLPDKFAVIIDGWSKGSTHFVGVFATFPSLTDNNGYSTALLSFWPMVQEASFTAQDHYDHLDYVLSVFNKNIENVVAITGVLIYHIFLKILETTDR